MAIQDRPYTTEDLSALPDDGRRYELDRGMLIVMPPPKREHGLVLLEISSLIRNHVRAHDLGQVVAEIGYQLSENPDTVRAPDVSFTSKAHLTPRTADYDRTAPDLAVEVASPGNSASDLNEKISQYFQAGVRQVWVLYPGTRTIYIYTSPVKVAILSGEDTLDGKDVLAGFRAKVADIFAVLD